MKQDKKEHKYWSIIAFVFGYLLVISTVLNAKEITSIAAPQLTFTQTGNDFTVGNLAIMLENPPPNITSIMFQKGDKLKFAYNFSLPDKNYKFVISFVFPDDPVYSAENKTIKFGDYIVDYSDVTVNGFAVDWKWNNHKGTLTLSKNWNAIGAKVGDKIEVDPTISQSLPSDVPGQITSENIVIADASTFYVIARVGSYTNAYVAIFKTTDGGTTWSNNTYAFGSGIIDITAAILPNGNVVAVWENSTSDTLWFGNFSTGTYVSGSARQIYTTVLANIRGPRIFSANSNTQFLACISGGLVCANTTDGGLTWSGYRSYDNFTVNVGWDGYVSPVDGSIHFISFGSSLKRYVNTTDFGNTFTDMPGSLPATYYNGAPSGVLVDRKGIVHLFIWDQAANTFQYRNSSNGWAAGWVNLFSANSSLSNHRSSQMLDAADQIHVVITNTTSLQYFNITGSDYGNRSAIVEIGSINNNGNSRMVSMAGSGFPASNNETAFSQAVHFIYMNTTQRLEYQNRSISLPLPSINVYNASPMNMSYQNSAGLIIPYNATANSTTYPSFNCSYVLDGTWTSMGIQYNNTPFNTSLVGLEVGGHEIYTQCQNDTVTGVSPTVNFNIYNPHLTNCTGAGADPVILNYTAMEEFNLSATNFNFDGSLRLWDLTQTVYTELNYSGKNLTSLAFCGTPGYLDTFVTYSGSLYGTQVRDNFMLKAAVNTSVINKSLVVINTTSGYLTKILVTDATTNIQPNKYIQVKKLYIGEGWQAYTEVAWGKSGADGIADTYLAPNDVWYKFVIYEANGTMDQENDAQKISCIMQPCELKLTLGSSYYTNPFKYIDGVTYSCHNSTSLGITYIVCSINDPTGTITSGRLQVDRINATNRTMICNTTVAGSSPTMTCSLGAAPSGSYMAMVFSSASPEIELVNSIFTWGSALTSFSWQGTKDSVFYGMAVTMSLGLIGIVVPEVGLVLALVGLIMSNLLGFILLSVPFIIMLAVAIAVIIYKMRL